MDNVSAYLLARLGHYDYCLWRPIAPDVCMDFWVWVMVGSFALGLYLFYKVIRGYFIYQRKVEAAVKAEAKRQAVNVEAIEALKWTGDDHYAAQ